MDEWISFAFEQMRLCSLSLCYSHSSECYIQMHKYINCTCINKPNVESSVKSFRWKSDLIWKSYRDNMPLNINGITSQRHHIVVIMGGWDMPNAMLIQLSVHVERRGSATVWVWAVDECTDPSNRSAILLVQPRCAERIECWTAFQASFNEHQIRVIITLK